MESTSVAQPATVSSKSSGIPRVSRLPVAGVRSSLPVSKPLATPKAPSRQSINPSTTPRRSSILPSPGYSAQSTRSGPSKSASAQLRSSTSRNPTHKTPNPTSTSGRSTSTLGGSRRLAAGPRSKRVDDEEHGDQLGALDGFRASSRQGFTNEDPFEGPDADIAAAEPRRPETSKRGPRLSLSDRTIESLANVPSTPKDRRRSSFFSPVASPMGPPPRPPSALSRNGSATASRPGSRLGAGPTSRPNSRPSTSDGPSVFARPTSPSRKAPATVKPSTRTSIGGFGFTPRTDSKTRRSISSTFTKPFEPPKFTTVSRVTPSSDSTDVQPPNKVSSRPPQSKTLAARPSKARPSMGHAFVPPEDRSMSRVPKENTDFSSRRTAPATSASQALREQIAAAKAAAKRGHKTPVKQDSPLQNDLTHDFAHHTEEEVGADLLNQTPMDQAHILRNRIRAALTDGRLNIAAMGLKAMPDQVLAMYEAHTTEQLKVSWAEVVDMTRLIVADNEIETLDEAVFPDVSGEALSDDLDSPGNQFGGLELLDLHGNVLNSLPLGLRRLERLTTLNLSHNKLDNGSIEIISQISCLKELRLDNNALTGHLASTICRLSHLETLDVRANRLLALPEAIGELSSLRILSVAGNQLTSIPMDALSRAPLVELDASSNALIGSLFPLDRPSTHSTLRTLSVAHNSLAALTFAESMELPQLQSLDVTNNHITSLTQLSASPDLISLMAGDNKLSDFPLGLSQLRKLRNVNLSGNLIRIMDPQIATMESLQSLVLTSNPLREKKYLTMSTADVKRDLAAKLEPAETDDGSIADLSAALFSMSRPGHPQTADPTWTLRQNGLLDLASKNFTDDVNDMLSPFLDSTQVKQLHLHHNSLTTIPLALSMARDLRILDLSNNAFNGDYISFQLELPSLQELNLNHCRLTSLVPLQTDLTAPNLTVLNVTANRLSGEVPALRNAFPALTTLFAGDNRFDTLPSAAIRGLHTVNLASNELGALPAEVGLLWDEGLRSLEVGGNLFRVPGYRVLEKGTEATLRWLRDRLPDAGQREARPAVETDEGFF